jgi:hypothetical protein
MAKKPKIMEIQKVKPRALSVKDAAEYIGLAPKTLRNRLGRRAKNPFPVRPRYYGGKPLFLIEELDNFLENLPTVPGE